MNRNDFIKNGTMAKTVDLLNFENIQHTKIFENTVLLKKSKILKRHLTKKQES